MDELGTTITSGDGVYMIFGSQLKLGTIELVVSFADVMNGTSDPFETDTSEKTDVWVVWHYPTLEVKMEKISQLHLLDRSLDLEKMQHFLCQDESKGLGVFTGINITADLEIIGQDKVIRRVDCRDCKIINSLFPGAVVFRDCWLGVVKETDVAVTIEVSESGRVVTFKDEMWKRWECQKYIIDKKSIVEAVSIDDTDSIGDEDSIVDMDSVEYLELVEFQPGDILHLSVVSLNKICDLGLNGADQKMVQIKVLSREVKHIGVHWLTRVQNGDGKLESKCKQMPNYILSADEIDKLQIVNQFQYCSVKENLVLQYCPKTSDVILTKAQYEKEMIKGLGGGTEKAEGITGNQSENIHALNKENPHAGTMVTVRVLAKHTTADVRWLDGSKTLDMDVNGQSRIVDASDVRFTFGQLVEKMDKKKSNQIGVVREVNLAERTCLVKWFQKDKRSVPTRFLRECEESELDLELAYPNFLCIGTIITKQEGFVDSKSECKPSFYVGQIVERMPEGNVKVRWIDGQTHGYWPSQFKGVLLNEKKVSMDSGESFLSIGEYDTITVQDRLQEVSGSSALPKMQTVSLVNRLLGFYNKCCYLDMLMDTNYFGEDKLKATVDDLEKLTKQTFFKNKRVLANKLCSVLLTLLQNHIMKFSTGSFVVRNENDLWETYGVVQEINHEKNTCVVEWFDRSDRRDVPSVQAPTSIKTTEENLNDLHLLDDLDTHKCSQHGKMADLNYTERIVIIDSFPNGKVLVMHQDGTETFEFVDNLCIAFPSKILGTPGQAPFCTRMKTRPMMQVNCAFSQCVHMHRDLWVLQYLSGVTQGKKLTGLEEFNEVCQKIRKEMEKTMHLINKNECEEETDEDETEEKMEEDETDEKMEEDETDEKMEEDEYEEERGKTRINSLHSNQDLKKMVKSLEKILLFQASIEEKFQFPDDIHTICWQLFQDLKIQFSKLYQTILTRFREQEKVVKSLCILDDDSNEPYLMTTYQMLKQRLEEQSGIMAKFLQIDDKDMPKKAKKPAKEQVSIPELAVIPVPEFGKTIDEKHKHFFQVLQAVPYQHKFKSNSFQPVNAKTVMKEMNLLQNNLPGGIHVRMFEDRMDLLSVMIEGPDETPYENGIFFFDFQLSADYPQSPPKTAIVNFASKPINPNLYLDGKVCLSLLGTWSGQGSQNWNPNKSNLLQLFISLQSLILVAEPYFNEPMNEALKMTKEGRRNSALYNQTLLITIIESLTKIKKNPPEAFKEVVQEYFATKSDSIIKRTESYLDNKVDLGAKPNFQALPIPKGIGMALSRALEAFKK